MKEDLWFKRELLIGGYCRILHDGSTQRFCKDLTGIIADYHSDKNYLKFIHNAMYSNLSLAAGLVNFDAKANVPVHLRHAGSLIILKNGLSEAIKDGGCITMTAKLICKDCQEKIYHKSFGGYWFQLGLLRIPQHFMHRYGLNEIERVYERKKKYCSSSNQWCSTIPKMDPKFKEFKSYVVQFCHTKLSEKSSMQVMTPTALRYRDSDVIKEQDTLAINLENKQNRYQLNVIQGGCLVQTINVGEQALHDEYLFSFASKRCDCPKELMCKGFSFDIGIQYA